MAIWSKISDNPDDPAVLTKRKISVSSSQRNPTSRLANFLETNLSDKNVLDLGYANHSSDTPSIAINSTHSYVVQFASSTLAVDIVEAHFHNSDSCQYETGNLLTDATFRTKILEHKTIDCLFAGSILEHLDNPSELFRLFRYMSSNCSTKELIVTVPNYLWIIGIYDLLSPATKDLSLNVDHVNTFYPGALVEIAERNDCQLTEWSYVGRDDMVKLFAPRPRKTQLIWAAAYWIARRLDSPFSHNLLAVKIVSSSDC